MRGPYYFKCTTLTSRHLKVSDHVMFARVLREIPLNQFCVHFQNFLYGLENKSHKVYPKQFLSMRILLHQLPVNGNKQL